ncbi:hypothetical protein FACS1894164_00930 [Spirochaetia bacterium]|nr:hypothetical protein FACS1894164_00930 [Spirochaetia bacterium]
MLEILGTDLDLFRYSADYQPGGGAMLEILGTDLDLFRYSAGYQPGGGCHAGNFGDRP